MEYIGNILYDKKLLEENRKIIIFGAGVSGRMIFDYLDLNGVKDRILCFCDSDKNKAGKNIAGISIYETEDILKKYPREDYLIAGKYCKEMYGILKRNDIDKVHIFI